MQNKIYPPLLASSETPEQISRRVQGIVIALSSLIIFGAGHFFNITLTANDVISLAGELGAVSGAIWTLFGFFMALLRKFKK
jgi:hypothetical protein